MANRACITPTVCAPWASPQVHLATSPPSASSGVRLQCLGMLVNVVSVSIPGRFDSEPDILDSPRWPTLLSPAGFAFAIWGVIYLGEFVGLAALCCNQEGVLVAAPSSRAWLCANIAQSLWCLAFRPWTLSRLWLSAFCLGTTAFCLLCSQRQLVADVARAPPSRVGFGVLALVAWPRSLHLGWVTAATLVNVNAWAGKARVGAPTAAAVFVLSVLGAVALADRYASFGMPTASLAVAWALFAVSKGKAVGRDADALGQPVLDRLALSAAGAAAFVLFLIAVRAWIHKRSSVATS